MSKWISLRWQWTFLMFLLGVIFTEVASAGIHAKGDVTFLGATKIDSYDSGFPGVRSSISGQYDPTKAGVHGDVSSNQGLISLGGAQVSGAVYTNSNYPFPKTVLPFTSGVAPAPGIILIPSGGSNAVASVTNSPTPPPHPAPGQTIVAVTNISYVSTTIYPGDQPGLKTNKTVIIVGTNTTVVTSTNWICGTFQYSGQSLPSDACSYTVRGNGGVTNYQYTRIVGTNYTYSTNRTYTYGTNNVYSYQQFYYTYTIYGYGSVTYQTNVYDHILCGDYYCPGGLGGNTIVTCPSRAVLPAGFIMGGADNILIQPGASLLLYVDGGDCVMNVDAIVNKSVVPMSLGVLCSDAVSDVRVNGSGIFSGTITAPNTQVTLNPNGTSPLDFSGLLRVASLTVNGDLNFHYDEALARSVAPLPLVSPAGLDGNGSFLFSVHNQGVDCILETSTNLLDWTPVVTNSYSFIFTNDNPAASQQFYRIVWP